MRVEVGASVNNYCVADIQPVYIAVVVCDSILPIQSRYYAMLDLRNYIVI